jgi:hypothetical protein
MPNVVEIHAALTGVDGEDEGYLLTVKVDFVLITLLSPPSKHVPLPLLTVLTCWATPWPPASAKMPVALKQALAIEPMYLANGFMIFQQKNINLTEHLAETP